MSYTIPTTEPDDVRCGDRWLWTKSLGDYPATDGWMLTYYLRGLESEGTPRVINITTTADGADHAVDVSSATTAAYLPGTYWWISSVSDGSSRHEVDHGMIILKPDFATLSGSYDGRSSVKKILDALELTILSAAARPESSYSLSVAGKSFNFKSLSELELMRDKYASLYAQEVEADLAKKGKATGRNILIQFANA